MAYTALTSPLPQQFHSPFHHQKRTKPNSVLHCSMHNYHNHNPKLRTWAPFKVKKSSFWPKESLINGPKVDSKVESSAEGEAETLEPDATYKEDFSWPSVILPFLFPALGGLLFGYDIGATSGATISLQSPELSGTTWFNLSSIQLGLVVSSSLYGALFGSLLVYPIADFLGRRRELIVASLLYVLGGLITAYAPELGILLLGRLLYGLGIGMKFAN